MKTVFTILVLGTLLSCQNQKSSDSKNDNESQKVILEEKIKHDSSSNY